MLALPVVLLKIKGFDIIKGDIEDDVVTEKMYNYHPIVIQLPSNGFQQLQINSSLINS